MRPHTLGHRSPRGSELLHDLARHGTFKLHEPVRLKTDRRARLRQRAEHVELVYCSGESHGEILCLPTLHQAPVGWRSVSDELPLERVDNNLLCGDEAVAPVLVPAVCVCCGTR